MIAQLMKSAKPTKRGSGRMGEKLKPCPFCGTTEHLFIENREEPDPIYISDHVVCGMCGAMHLKDDDLGWNNRPTEKATRKEVLELVEKHMRYPATIPKEKRWKIFIAAYQERFGDDHG